MKKKNRIMSKMFEIVVMIKKTTHPNATHFNKIQFSGNFFLYIKKRIKNVTDSHESSIKMRFCTKRIGCIIPYTMLNATFCRYITSTTNKETFLFLHFRLLMLQLEFIVTI